MPLFENVKVDCTVRFPSAAIEAVETVRVECIAAWFALLSIKNVVFEDPADAVPALYTVVLMVTSTNAVALSGATPTAMRSGQPSTETEFAHETVCEYPPDETVTDAVLVPVEA